MNKTFKEFLDEIEKKKSKKEEPKEEPRTEKDKDPNSISDIRELSKYKKSK